MLAMRLVFTDEDSGKGEKVEVAIGGVSRSIRCMTVCW